MKTIIVLLLAFTLMTSFQSCRKEEEPDKTTAKEIITNDSWTWVRFEFFDTDENLISETEPNTKWVFTPTNDYFIYDTGNFIYQYGDWQLLDNDSKVHIKEHSGLYDYTFDIDELTEKKFTLTYTVITGHGTYYFER